MFALESQVIGEVKAFPPAPDIIFILDKSSPGRTFRTHTSSSCVRERATTGQIKEGIGRTSNLHSPSQRPKIGMIDYQMSNACS